MKCAILEVEELAIDLYYWFDKSTKRKNGLLSYCTFCDQEYRAIVRHVTTRWLSLEIAIERILKQFASLVSYFKSEEESQARFRRLRALFDDPITELYLLFFQSTLPAFTHANKLLQREEPLVHVLQPQLVSLLISILQKFIWPAVLVSAIHNGTVSSIDLDDEDNHVSDDKLVVGFLAKQEARQLLEAGDISAKQHANFFVAARSFLVWAVKYLLKWCPLNDELLINATWLTFEKRLDVSFNSVEFFVHRYPQLFDGISMDQLQEQFLNYQLLKEEEIPKNIKERAGLKSEDPFRVDHLWGYLRVVKTPGTNSLKFDLLFRVAEAVMTIPHSNAGEERIFSLIQKNKTPGRDSLQLDGTLSSLMLVKTHIDDVINWKPDDSLLDAAKKATRTYNATHQS